MSKGQSLIELLISMGIFVAIVSVVAVLLTTGYIFHLLTGENSLAVFLAEEGLESARSIRDDNWHSLAVGSYGLGISQGHWIFQGAEEDISQKLSQGKRKIIIEDAGTDRKKITSEINWQSFSNRNRKIELKTFLTNWQRQSD